MAYQIPNTPSAPMTTRQKAGWRVSCHASRNTFYASRHRYCFREKKSMQNNTGAGNGFRIVIMALPERRGNAHTERAYPGPTSAALRGGALYPAGSQETRIAGRGAPQRVLSESVGVARFSPGHQEFRILRRIRNSPASQRRSGLEEGFSNKGFTAPHRCKLT